MSRVDLLHQERLAENARLAVEDPSQHDHRWVMWKGHDRNKKCWVMTDRCECDMLRIRSYSDTALVSTRVEMYKEPEEGAGISSAPGRSSECTGRYSRKKPGLS